MKRRDELTPAGCRAAVWAATGPLGCVTLLVGFAGFSLLIPMVIANRVSDTPPAVRRWLAVAAVSLLVLFLVLSVAESLLLSRREVRRRKGLCPGCGYDIRASTSRCPECGREIECTP